MMKKIEKITLVIAFAFLITSCESFFNVNPDDLLLEENYPSTVTELYSGYLGISAKVQVIADRVSFLEGLKGDFLEPTANATQDMIDIYNLDEDNRNVLADPSGYYAIILNANDYIVHATKFYENNPTAIDETSFKAIVGGALRYKSWAYLMIAKIYGKSVWIDDPLAELQDIAKYPVLDFDQTINSCINLIETGIVINEKPINGKGIVKWSTILFPDGTTDYSWDCIDPAPEILLGELYLYSGNYQLAFDNLLALLKIGSADNRLEITKSEYNGEWIDLFKKYVRKEAIFLMTYDYNLKQTNNLVNYYSNTYPNKYYLRPTQVAMDRFRNQKQSNGNPGDNWRGENRSFKLENNEWVVYKFLSAHLSSDYIYRNDVQINLYRASDLHLMLAEALGQLGRFEEALAFLDGGLETYYNSASGFFNAPFDIYPSTLYASGGDGTTQGIRTRVTMAKVAGSILKTPDPDQNKDKQFLDSLLVEEACLEFAGEGKALYTMIRMAKRWNDPSIVADRVSAKYPDGLKATVREKLMNPENWFIKRDLVVDKQ